MFKHIIGLFFNSETEWRDIREKLDNNRCAYIPLVFILALIPPISGYIGTTQFGWKIGSGDPVKLTNASAGMIAIAYYFAIVVGIFVVGKAINWMAQTYGADEAMGPSIALATFVAVPLLLVGVFEIYPVLWVNMIIGLIALAYSVKLLYQGVPIMLNVNEEKGFLYASAILGFGMVALVGLLVVTAILWGSGWAPSFAS